MATFRPRGVWLGSGFEAGLEVDVVGGRVGSVRATSRAPEALWILPGFVNAHSHLEYRNLLGRLPTGDYWNWLRAITAAKRQESVEEVLGAAHLAAAENRRSGVAAIGEHMDRLGADEALPKQGITGWLLDEVITIGDRARLATRRERASVPVNGVQRVATAHSLWSVDRASLQTFIEQVPLSLHVAEHPIERALFERGEGPIADVLDHFGEEVPRTGLSPLQTMHAWGLLSRGVQVVHACDLDSRDLELLAESGATVAHCPRSNKALGCPPAPVSEMLARGIPVGLGMDSAASSGPVDMLAEMRAVDPQVDPWPLALRSLEGHPRRATDHPCLAIRVEAQDPEELLARARLKDIEWL